MFQLSFYSSVEAEAAVVSAGHHRVSVSAFPVSDGSSRNERAVHRQKNASSLKNVSIALLHRILLSCVWRHPL